MKLRIFVALLACCLLLCGCSSEEASSTPETTVPEVTAAPTTAPATPDEPIVDENGVPSLTVSEGPELTIPDFVWGGSGGIDLPIDEFDEDEEHYAVPIGTTAPPTTEGNSTEDDPPAGTTSAEKESEEPTMPASTWFPGDVLPEDVWEDE